MKFYAAVLAAALVSAPAASAASREIVELQRDVAAIGEQMRTLQRSLDEKVGALNALTQQTLDNVNRTNTSMAVLENGVSARIGEQVKGLTGPVTAVGAKVDQMSTDMQSLREGLADLVNRMGKMQQQITDLDNTIKVMQNPPAPPSAPGLAPQGATSPPPAGMSSRQVWEGAMRDRTSGNFDMALQGLDTYLKYYGSTELAPDAQFYVGQIYYDKGDFPSSLKAFDAVLERYSENNKTPDAAYMKGMALLKSNQSTAAGREFLNVIEKYPNTEAATRSRSQRKALGLSIPTAAPAKASAKKKS